jgi:prepilin signal peptidase PulO-like enzyme (type II secretory pathway)
MKPDDRPEPALSMQSAVPFGPFLILGWLIVFFSNLTLF